MFALLSCGLLSFVICAYKRALTLASSGSHKNCSMSWDFGGRLKTGMLMKVDGMFVVAELCRSI